MNYFYDKQVKRYLLQIQRIFSEFYVSDGKKKVGDQVIERHKRVPIVHGINNSIAASFLTGNSENTLQTVPMMVFYINDIQPITDTMRIGQHNDTVRHYTEKARNPDGTYNDKVAGNKFTITQNAPTTFNMTITVDIKTSSYDQKLELFEQIVVYFNPGFQFRVNRSEFDMGQVSNIELESTTWSNKGMPIGDDDGSDFFTLTFKVSPVYISSPAKLSVQKRITSIHTNINQLVDVNDPSSIQDVSMVTIDPKGKLIITKDQHSFYGQYMRSDGTLGDWSELFSLYGSYNEFVRMAVDQPKDNDSEISQIYANGTLTEDPTKLMIDYDIDTLKADTLNPVDKIISGANVNDYNSPEGTRLLLASDMENNPSWDNLSFPAGAIIQRNLTGWQIAFDPNTNSGEYHYVTNSLWGIQYRFDGFIWSPTLEGEYQSGQWVFDIQG